MDKNRKCLSFEEYISGHPAASGDTVGGLDSNDSDLLRHTAFIRQAFQVFRSFENVGKFICLFENLIVSVYRYPHAY